MNKKLFKYLVFSGFALLLISILTISSCRHDPMGIEQLDTVCFNTQVLPILQTSCGISGCHDNYGEAGFTTQSYDDIMKIVKSGSAKRSKLYEVITTTGGEGMMPPDRPLTREQRTIILVWIEQGAKNKVCVPDNGGGGGGGGDPLNYDTICFNQNIQPLLLSSCGKTGCHDAISHKEGYILTSYTTLRQNADAIIPFYPNSSKIYKVITATDPGDRMPPPPDPALTTDQKELIRKWISQGALNSDCPWTACDTSGTISFTQKVWPIVQNNCLGCHNATNASGGVNLSSYTQVKYYAETLRTGTPILIGALRHKPGFIAMPPSGILNNCQLRTFELWIQQGMLDN